MRQKQPFADICVLCQMNGSKNRQKYVDLIGSVLDDNEPETLLVSKDCKYLLTFSKVEDKNYRWVTDVTLPELLELANLHGKNFIGTIITNVDIGETLLAQVCAWKIMNYTYGSIVQTSDDKNSRTFQFIRQRFVNEESSRKRDHYVVFEKDFRKVACS